ncbi:methylaspartate mutase [Kitasatospora sp. NPDC088346]|uniref:methylaspartate mutase n=1 Tax=Kitasatospora sp. NPDC088346 TaxID=3364073 RepID=UPI0038041F1E
MSVFDELELHPEVAASLPPAAEAVGYLRDRGKPLAVDVLRAADLAGRPLVQPRCGVGGHQQMATLLRTLEPAGPGLLTLTIDSYTRLKQFATARRLLRENPGDLNGYPLVAHGWQRGRELNETVAVPLEVRHGSPDARDLFAVTVASGISSFEGGGITYNLPYSKDVPLEHSLRAWQQVDAACGRLADQGVVMDRELFGTLTAVLVPPSTSLALTLLEAVLAARAGVRCLSIAYPQGGEAHQDIAALRSVRTLARRYLPDTVEVFPVLHQFMGVFPHSERAADELILYGGLVARLGRATKVINKTNQEAHGIPDAAANAHGIRTTSLALSGLLDFVRLDEERIAEEEHWIRREVEELVEPVLQDGTDDLAGAVARAFAAGRLDIPFSASRHARSEVIPGRDPSGAVRYLHHAGLPFSAPTRHFQERRLGARADRDRIIERVTADINYFLEPTR